MKTLDPTSTYLIYSFLIPIGEAVELSPEDGEKQWNLAVALYTLEAK